ncbi:NAD(P)-binding protein [Streptomyces sp. NPDC050538]|uniref:NAD(P)-binding protein n=1 Tax=Streptomyces sp. NPDC050538 TaxID=3365627 RepID=UPI00378C47D4
MRLATTHDVIVIGAGASGPTAASAPQADGRDVLPLEARDRIGGRPLSSPSSASQQALDLGPPGSGTATSTRGACRTRRRRRLRPALGPHPRQGAACRPAATGHAGHRRPHERGGPTVRTRDATPHAAHVVPAVPPALAPERIDFAGTLPGGLIRPARSGAGRTGPPQEIHDESGPGGGPRSPAPPRRARSDRRRRAHVTARSPSQVPATT